MTVKFVIIKLCNKECNAMLCNKEFCKKKTLHCIGQVQKDVQREREYERFLSVLFKFSYNSNLKWSTENPKS